MSARRTVTIVIDIEQDDYYADEEATRDWAQRLFRRIMDLRMSQDIVSLDWKVTD